MNFSDNLKATRERKNVQVKTLADALGVKPYTISDWETGRSEPSITNLIKLATYFNVSVDFLIGNTLPSNEMYDDIIEIINSYQKSIFRDELNELFSGLTPKNRKKFINIIKCIKQEMFTK